MSDSRLAEFLEKITKDLDRTVQFWLSHSHDEEYGGFFNCVGKEGKVYDELKHIWLQARQVWMYCRLYNEVERFRKQNVLDAAVKGAEFLMKYAKNPDTYKCYLVVTRDGKPVKVQMTLFSECFYLMAMSEAGRATGSQKYKDEALKMMEKIQHCVKTHGESFGIFKLEGVAAFSKLAIAMMVLCIIDQMQTMDPSLDYKEFADWALKDALKHVQRDGTCILENTTPDAKELPGSDGRLMNPGHAIEAGWFLLQHAVKTNNAELKQTALQKFILNPFSYGWDAEFGGLFYFLDADGLSPTQLEWDMKLWWPHNEALISFLMAYKETKDVKYLDNFAKVFDYSYSHFVDEESGEWYGYLNRKGEITHRFKGGPWKGCFHVPRCLMMCEQMLKELLNKK